MTNWWESYYDPHLPLGLDLYQAWLINNEEMYDEHKGVADDML
jgi:hypothetical protein